MTDTETRLRAGLAECARAMRVERPAVDDLFRPRPGALRRQLRSPRGRAQAGASVPAPLRSFRRRVVVVVAAAFVVVAVGVAVVSRSDDGAAPVMTQPGAVPASVWPLGEAVPAEVLASPESAADAYISRVAGVGPEWQRSEVEYDGEGGLPGSQVPNSTGARSTAKDGTQPAVGGASTARK
jgi:hypothetical protein